ncbi:MAG: 16S rRNA (cytidine(1402)-2'-O)-methyltransferase, partial [Dehalococcoidia bacterium]
ATLQDLLAALGDRPVAVARELTKLHEEIFRGTLSQALEHFGAPRGELVLVVAGSESGFDAGAAATDLDQVREQLARLRASGSRANESVAEVVASSGLPRNTVYQLWLESDKSQEARTGSGGDPSTSSG